MNKKVIIGGIILIIVVLGVWYVQQGRTPSPSTEVACVTNQDCGGRVITCPDGRTFNVDVCGMSGVCYEREYDDPCQGQAE